MARLATARTPVIIVDVEVRRYGIEDRRSPSSPASSGIPVVTTFMGRGLLESARRR